MSGDPVAEALALATVATEFIFALHQALNVGVSETYKLPLYLSNHCSQAQNFSASFSLGKSSITLENICPICIPGGI